MSNEWISVEDELPKVWSDVLLFNTARFPIPGQGVGYRVDRRDGANMWHFNDVTRTRKDGETTHWMPLPSPPDTGEK